MKRAKLNFKITKKQIIIACLTLFLGIAVYANYLLAQGTSLKPTDVIEGVNLEDDYGEVLYVNGTEYYAYSSDDYFAQARLDKATSREEAVETLQMVLSGQDVTEEEIAVYTEEAISLTALIESENVIESLIKAAGYEDCVVYLDNEGASIVVKTDGLTSSDAAEIKDILLSEVYVLNENIRIFEVK